MSRPRGSIIGAKPTWTTTATSGIWTLRHAEEMKAANQWPRGPVAPTSLAGTPGDGQVALTWTAPATTHGTITDYVVEYTPAAGSPTVVATGSTAASYTLTGLTNDTEYTIRVAGVNHTRGDYSDSVAVTPSAASGWGISTAVFSQSFSVAAQLTSPQSVFFKPDGLVMYIAGGTEVRGVLQYNLSTAWDIGTAVYAQSFSAASQELAPTGTFFSPDGLKMYVVGSLNDSVNEYNLSTAWDISTASYAQNFSVASQEQNPQGVFFKPDGLKMYVVGFSGDDVNEYNLGTAWNVTTAGYVQNFSVASQETLPMEVFFNPDGVKMYVVGTFGGDVNEYDLATAWDISTASYVQNFSVASQDSVPRAVFFKPDGLKMYVVGEGNSAVYEYSL